MKDYKIFLSHSNFWFVPIQEEIISREMTICSLYGRCLYGRRTVLVIGLTPVVYLKISGKSNHKPKWTGMCGALDTRPPSGPNRAQLKSRRSLILVEIAVRCRTRPICSAIDINRWPKIESATRSIVSLSSDLKWNLKIASDFWKKNSGIPIPSKSGFFKRSCFKKSQTNPDN